MLLDEDTVQYIAPLLSNFSQEQIVAALAAARTRAATTGPHSTEDRLTDPLRRRLVNAVRHLLGDSSLQKRSL